MEKRVLVADPIANEGIEKLRQEATVEVKTGLTPQALKSIIGDYEALVVRSETRVTADVVEEGKKLQVIARAGVGVDNIDVEAATRRGVVVVNAPSGNTVSAAEHTIAMMLALARHIPQAHGRLKGGTWDRKEFVGIEVRNKTLGIVGLGNVGSEVARRAKGLQMNLIGHDPYVSTEYARNLGVELLSLDEVLRRADFLTLHIPLSPETRGMIGPKALQLVKPTVRIINCARGELIDEEVLYQALEAGQVAGAAVDVFSVEPACDNILCKSDKVVVTPHLAGSTAEAQVVVSLDIAEQVLAVFAGKPARYAVNMPFISAEIAPLLAPYMELTSIIGKLSSQLLEGQLEAIKIQYDGEVAQYNTAALKAALLQGLLEKTSEEKVNLINANLLAAKRGVRVIEQKGDRVENYASLITAQLTSDTGITTIAGTTLRGESHIVRVNEYWIDIVPTGRYFIFSDHRDRPGLIGAVGMVTGRHDVNISSMLVSRLKPRGQALMVLGVDEPITEELKRQLLDIPDVYTVKLARL